MSFRKIYPAKPDAGLGTGLEDRSFPGRERGRDRIAAFHLFLRPWRIDRFRVGLDVDHGSPVQCIEPPDREDAPVDTQEIDEGEGDRVGPVRRPGRKNAAFHAVVGRSGGEPAPVGPIEPAEDVDVLLFCDFEEAGPYLGFMTISETAGANLPWCGVSSPLDGKAYHT